MKYRVAARRYVSRCQPLLWQSSGLYDFDDALALAARMREKASDELGNDVWLVPA